MKKKIEKLKGSLQNVWEIALIIVAILGVVVFIGLGIGLFYGAIVAVVLTVAKFILGIF